MNAVLVLALMSGLCDRIDQYVAPLQTLDVFSGVVLVAKNDSILCERAYGKASVELDVPMSVANRFRIASVSKSFTASMVGVLADRAKLSLSDSIARWLPTFPSADRITVEMLLQHRGGVPNRNSIPYDEEAVATNSLAALIDSIAKIPLDFPPGTARRYSNGGYAVLARIIELIEGDRYENILYRDILKPLGLANTRHENDGDVVPYLAGGYMSSPHTFGLLARAPYQQTATKTGGGSLVSDAHDLLRWARAIGRSDILREATWNHLFTRIDGVLAFQGRSPGYNVFMSNDEKTGITAIVLANNYNAAMVDDVADALVRLANDEEPTPLSVTAPQWEAQTAAVEGTYLTSFGAIAIRRNGSRYIAYIEGTPVDILIPQPRGRFLARALWSTVEFTADSLRISALYRANIEAAGRVPQTVELDVYSAVLRFFRPAPNQVRWISADTIGETMAADLVQRAGNRFFPYDASVENRSGGLVRLSRIEWLGAGRARVRAQFRQVGPHHTGDTIHLTFTVVLHDGKWRAEQS